MNVNLVLLDIDGVCNRFIWHAFDKYVHGLFNDEREYPIEAGFDVVKAINIVGRKHYDDWEDLTTQGFWTAMTHDDWATCRPSHEFEYLLRDAANLVGQKNVFFATSPAHHHSSASGKVQWIQRFAPKWIQRQYMIGSAKWLLAQPDRLLVDDSDEKVDAFRAAGGQALLVPRPWNSCHMLNTADTLSRFWTSF